MDLFANNLLSDNYEMSELINSSLNLLPGDSYEIALGKLEKAIIDNEKVATNALIYLDENKLDSSVISAVGLSNDYNDLDNLPVISSFVTLSSSYVMSSSSNEELKLIPGDEYETAFSKLEKAIIDNEEIVTQAIIYLDENKLNSDSISRVGLTNNYNDLDNLPVIPSLTGFATESFVNASINTLKDYIDSSINTLKNYVDSSVNNLKDYVDSSLVLSSSYVMSSSYNNDL